LCDKLLGICGLNEKYNNKNEKQQIQINIHDIHWDSKQDILHNFLLGKEADRADNIIR
jgi:hypothetical protein